MDTIKVIPLDLEGTLVTLDYSLAVYYREIPSIYAVKNGISFDESLARVTGEYDRLGSQQYEWYDIKYWFRYFQIEGYQAVLARCRNYVACYPETISVLSRLSESYPLVVSTGTAAEFLPYLMSDIKRYFVRTFSSVSDYGQVKTPDFYLKVCKEMDVSPQAVVHIGDNRQFDFTSPVEAGMRAFYLDRDGHSGLDSVIDLRQFASRLMPGV